MSGVVPKFPTPETRAIFCNGTLATERHIVKGSSVTQPFMALNEHLCMEAARRTGFDAAMAQVSDDGHVLAVKPFNIDPVAPKRLGFEDFCSLLGLDPTKNMIPRGSACPGQPGRGCPQPCWCAPRNRWK